MIMLLHNVENIDGKISEEKGLLVPREGLALLLEVVIKEAKVLPPSGLGLWLFFGVAQLDLLFCLHCALRVSLFCGVFQSVFYSDIGLAASLAHYVFCDPSDDVLDVTMLDHHLLMMAVALCWGSGSDRAADEHVDLDVFSLLGSQTEEFLVAPKEAYVLLLFCLGPGKVRLPGPGFLALYNSEDAILLVGGSCSFEGFRLDLVLLVDWVDVKAVVHVFAGFLFS